MTTKDPDWMIDTAGKDSFPASDPPYRTPILLGVLGVVALAGVVIGIRYARNR
jgi:hypothetical protein